MINEDSFLKILAANSRGLSFENAYLDWLKSWDKLSDEQRDEIIQASLVDYDE